MASPLSNDLRERVVAAVRDGASCRVVASRFGVAVPSVVKWSQRARRTGSVAPGQMGGHRRPILEPHRDAKTRGLNIEDTRLTCPRKLALLMAIVAIAFAWADASPPAFSETASRTGNPTDTEPQLPGDGRDRQPLPAAHSPNANRAQMHVMLPFPVTSVTGQRIVMIDG
jgi:transposase-like protein